MRTMSTCTGIPSKIYISSTLDTCNFFLGWVVLHHILGKFLDIGIY
jgi:hypothetical protein